MLLVAVFLVVKEMGNITQNIIQPGSIVCDLLRVLLEPTHPMYGECLIIEFSVEWWILVLIVLAFLLSNYLLGVLTFFGR